MSPANDLTTVLTLLTAALDDPDIDLPTELAALAGSARDAVDSYLGLCVTATIDTIPTLLTVPPAPWPDTPRTSLRLTPPTPTATATTAAPPHSGPLSETTTPVAITLYASTAGAFVDLAADLAFQSGTPLATIALDQHLPGPAHPDHPATHVTVTVSDLTLINQAIGVLIDQGHEPHHARAALHHTAATTGITVTAAAILILGTTHR